MNMKTMYGQIVDEGVASINEWVADLSRDNNNCMKHMDDGAREWAYVRLAALAPIAAVSDLYKCCDDDDMYPEDTTHMLIVGVEHWDNELADRAIYGNIFPVAIVDNLDECIVQYQGKPVCVGAIKLLEDVDEVLGGGPELQDASVDECKEWMIDVCGSASIVDYGELDMSTVDLMGDSHFSNEE